jgi:hypothetical protein
MARGGKAAAAAPAAPAQATVTQDQQPPAVTVEGEAPVRKIDSQTLTALGQELGSLFVQYAADRRLTELKWLRNLRQYLGIYDPEIEREIGGSRSRAYPRVTRIKVVSTLSRIMNLMYPGNERNWELNASPCPEMDPADVAQAVSELVQERQGDGVPTPVTMEMVDYAVQRLADQRACELTKLIDDQLQEIGGNQTLDIIALDRKVALSGILYGLGVLEGPYVREIQKSGWMQVLPTQAGQQPTYKPIERTIRKPQYDFCSVWDFYPDMSAKTLWGVEGYFLRKVMGRSQVRKLADRDGFFADQVKKYLSNNTQGNYKPREFEVDLRSMGTKAHVNDSMKQDPQSKYEIIVWKGPVSARKLQQLGIQIAEDKLADDIEAEIWLIDNIVIRADMNPWRKLGMDVRTVHCFNFDEDDTSPIANGLPYVIRDSQMSVAAATRMTLDNASVTCGPNLEVNTSLMQPGQDLSGIEAYKIWLRDDDGPTSQYPAVRKVDVDGHLAELQSLIKLFMDFADAESFVGPATGGDMQSMPSEPMRTAAGASMLRGEAALPFKDIIRNFDTYKQSVIEALVAFNKKFNPALAPEGDYNVVARGATSLIAKEVRGAQLDQLAQTLRPEDWDNIDERKFLEQRFAVRDMSSLLLPEEEAERKKAQREASQAQMAQIAQRLQIAQERSLLSQAFKNITQGQKNSAAADAQSTGTAISILEHGLPDGVNDDGNDAKDGSQSSGSRAGG